MTLLADCFRIIRSYILPHLLSVFDISATVGAVVLLCPNEGCAPSAKDVKKSRAILSIQHALFSQIEQPFSVLPLELFCATIRSNVIEQLQAGPRKQKRFAVEKSGRWRGFKRSGLLI